MHCCLYTSPRSIPPVLPERLAGLGLPECFLGAGCVAQTVWNAAHGKPPDADISDYDIVYFNAGDLTEEPSDQVTSRAAAAAEANSVHALLRLYRSVGAV